MDSNQKEAVTLSIQLKLDLLSQDAQRQAEAADRLTDLARLSPALAAPLIRLALCTQNKMACRNAAQALPALAAADTESATTLFADLFRGEIGDLKSLEPITELIALAHTAPRPAARILKQLLLIPNDIIHAHVALALPAISQADPLVALPLTEEALADPDPCVRSQGAMALVPLAASYPALAEMPIALALQDTDDQVLLPARKAERTLEQIMALSPTSEYAMTE